MNCLVETSSIEAYLDAAEAKRKRATDELVNDPRPTLRRRTDTRTHPDPVRKVATPRRRTGRTSHDREGTPNIDKERETTIREDEILGPEAAAPTPRGRAAERQEEIPRPTEEPISRRVEQEEDTTMEDTPEKREVVKRRQRKSEVELAVDPEDFVTRAILDAKTIVTIK